MTDLLDGQDFHTLMETYRFAVFDSEMVEARIAMADVKNYIRIHCVVPEEKDEGVPW